MTKAKNPLREAGQNIVNKGYDIGYGWFGESARHSLAKKGIKTGRKGKITDSMLGSEEFWGMTKADVKKEMSMDEDAKIIADENSKAEIEEMVENLGQYDPQSRDYAIATKALKIKTGRKR